jgi:aminopeptidase N
MEYPMMANDNSHPENPDFTRFVAEHEIAHTYFPFYMGTNETRFGFMDEGWAVTLEYLIGIVDLGKKQATENYKRFRVNSWINDPSFEQDLPIITPTNVLSGRAMGNNEYGKASLGYLALQDLLGEKEFKKALQGYMKRWNGKHPIPWDFFYSFNDITGKNLNWFWKSWFFSNNYIDYAIENVRTQNNNTFIKIKNSGGMPAPFTIDVVKDNGTKKSFHYSPKMWKDVNDAVIVRLEKIENPRSISLNGGIFMDADRSNNEWKK